MKNPTEKTIAEWKLKYGGVFAFEVDDKICFLKEPKMKDFKYAFSALQDESEIAFGEAMLGSLWIDGDAEIKNNDDYFLTARKELSKLLKFDDAETQDLENRETLIKIGEESVKVRVITRDDLKMAEKRNPAQKPFVTQEILFDLIKIKDSASPGFEDKDKAEIRFPLYGAIEKLQNKKVAQLKKL
jgi:hypothetical protein